MSDYISRDAAIELLHYNTDERCSAVVSDFEEIPAADVEPVRHGRWDAVKRDKTTWTCSRCGKRTGAYIAGTSNYCPWCGCKMDLEEAR